jgi:uncharacterized membrane protein YgdD (TMEM256/DUF423 family)
MERTFFALGAISACIAVGTGAFGAHGLKARVTPVGGLLFLGGWLALAWGALRG